MSAEPSFSPSAAKRLGDLDIIVGSAMSSSTGGPAVSENRSFNNDSAKIREELEAICGSNGFVDSPRLRQFLTFVVEAYLRGESAQLKETVIGVEVYGRAHTYNPKAEPIVRTEARRLRAKLKDYYDHQGSTDQVVIALPTGGYAPRIAMRVAPTSSDTAVAPPSATDEPATGRRPLANPKSRRTRLTLGLLALLAALCLGWFAWTRLTSPKVFVLHQMTDQLSEARVTASAISPDGKFLAYGTSDGIFLQVVRTKETHLLRSPDNFWPDRIRWLPDQDKLAVGGIYRKTLKPAIWVVSLAGGAPLLLHANARDPEPNSDGTRVAYTTLDRSEIWISDLGGEEPRRIVKSANQRMNILFWSHDGSHLTFAGAHFLGELDPTSEARVFGELSREETRIFQSVDVASGVVETRSFKLNTYQAAASNGDRVVFLSPNEADRGAGYKLWEFAADARTGEPSNPPHPLPVLSDWMRDVSISSDGRIMTVVRLATFPSVYVADYSANPPALSNVRRLALDGNGSFPHSWTTDSKTVIFESDRRGNNDLFRQDLDSRVADNIVATPREDFHANVTPDGHWLLFMQSELHKMRPASIMRVPLAGGPSEQLVPNGEVDEFRCAPPGGRGCVARKTVGKDSYVFYDLDPLHGIGRLLASTKWLPNYYGDWALSPQGTEVAIPDHEPSSAKIRVVQLNGGGESELPIAGVASISGLNWAADGKGWFVGLNSTFGRRLIYVDRKGSATLLLDGAGYAIASPDGKRVAMNIPSASSNVWSINGL